MQFAQPDNLFSLLVLLPMLGAFVGYWMWKHRLMESAGDHAMLAAMAAASSSRRQVARAVFALLGTALLCLAVAQPQWGQTNQPIRRTGVDVVFAMDLSQSMMAQDVSPNRLRAAKDEIETTLEVLEGDRVGLVVFTAVSFVQTPLTIDYGAIRFYLNKLRTEQMPMGGTSIGRAVTDAVELLTGERTQGDGDDGLAMRRAKSQIVVLITDGEDHESDPIAAAELAKKHNIKIVTVGFGSTEGERIPVYRPSGELAGFKRDRAGNIVHTRLDTDTLKQVATMTGGTFIHYSGVNSVADELVAYVNRLEKSEIETLMRERYRERFGFFLVPALIFLVLSLLLGDRKRAGRRAKHSTLAAIVLLAVFASGCERAFEDTQSSVDKGNERIAAGDYEGALEMYRLAEKQIPARPELHFDIGRALLGLERFDDAADSFARALETNDPVLQFDALYNLGLAHAGKEAWTPAWETFRDALISAERTGKIDEERLAEARWNLEVAWLNLHPPCAKLEDGHEDNDTPQTATQLEQPKVEKATLCGLDDDWYVIGAIPGTRVEVSARFRDLRDPHDPETTFLPKNTDLQIAVFDQTGQTAIAVDQGLTDELPTGRKASRSIQRFLVDETMVSAENPYVLLRVGAAEDLEFSYDIDIVSIPPCHALEEDLEDNDRPEEAKLLNPGNHPLHSCPADEDWFAVDLDIGDSFFVDLQTQPDAEREVPAELGLEIIAPGGEVVSPGEVEGQFVTAGVRDVREPTRFLVRVFGKTADEQGPYALDVYRYAPCVVGDDRFEQNDTANAAAPLDGKQPVHRYLRACDQDPDFYRIDYPEDAEEKRLNLALSRISTPAPGSEPTDQPQFEFDQVSASGDQILVAGARVEFVGDAEQPQIPIEQVIENESVEDGAAIVRVTGENEFYHLLFLDPPPQSEQDDSQEQDQEQQQDQQPGDDEQQEQDPGTPEDEEQDDSEGDDEQQSGDEGDEEEQSEPEQDADQSEQDEQGEDEQAAQADQADPEMERLEDLLEALEQTDDNFQMRKALENMPGRYIEKDW